MIFTTSLISPMNRAPLIRIGQSRLVAKDCAPNCRASGELLKDGGSMVHPWVFKSDSGLGDHPVTARSRIGATKRKANTFASPICSGSLEAAEGCVSACSCTDFVFVRLAFLKVLLKQTNCDLRM